MKPKIKVAILEHNSIFRLGLKKILTDDEIEIVGEAADGIAGMQVIRSQQPQIVLLANDLPKTNDISFLRLDTPKFSENKDFISIKKFRCSRLDSINLLKTSAKGFLTKDSGYLNKEVIQQIAEGKTYVQPDLVRKDIFQYAHPAHLLSHREYQVLTLMAQDHTHEVIAEKLNISIKTVFNIKYRGFKKLGVKTAEKLRQLFKFELIFFEIISNLYH